MATVSAICSGVCRHETKKRTRAAFSGTAGCRIGWALIPRLARAPDNWVALSELPVQARKVHAQILGGGPFRYDKDGTVFFNRERLLPRQARGFYREYTVPTPGVRHRGARRIVCGGKVVHLPETCFYTEDHYQSFREIDARR